jgi:hypothetical protein
VSFRYKPRLDISVRGKHINLDFLNGSSKWIWKHVCKCASSAHKCLDHPVGKGERIWEVVLSPVLKLCSTRNQAIQIDCLNPYWDLCNRMRPSHWRETPPTTYLL